MYLAIKLLSRFIKLLPPAAALCLGRLGGLMLSFNGRKRTTAFRNLKSVFPSKSNRQIFSLLGKSFMGFGMSIVESLIPDKISAHGYVDMHSLDKLRPEEGHILVCIHAASWELYNMLFARDRKSVV